MANEAVLRYRKSHPVDFTVADGAGIEKGTLLKVTDPRTAAAADGAADVIAGIAAREKIASDGRTQLAVYRDGVFDMVASGAITIGSAVCSSETGSNFVKTAVGVVAASGAAMIGHALETAADGETFQVEVNIGAGSN